jgi:ATP/maltotriose-dependent transcriptional regulator MalT
LLRGDDRRHFTAAEIELVCAVSRDLAAGLRRAIWREEREAIADEEHRAAGVLLVGPDNTLAAADAAAQHWLAELRDDAEQLPSAIAAVAGRARDIAAGRLRIGARVRVRARSGAWVVVRASTLGTGADASTAVTIERARADELAPLIADGLGLSPRERAVTELVASGFSTDAIAKRLHLSSWTIQDHLKAIFEKVGVATRGELVARLYFERRAPRLAEDA